MSGNPSVKKRDAVRERSERQQQKAMERRLRRERREAIIAQGGDPDIEGIVPGPQPKGTPPAEVRR